MMYGWGLGIGGALMALSMVLFWLLIIGVVVLAVRGLSGSVAYRETKPTALDALKERYAKGEIDTQEFEERKRNLER